MSTRTRRSLQVAVVVLGIFFFVRNTMDGMGIWDFLPLIAMVCGLSVIEIVRLDQERSL